MVDITLILKSLSLAFSASTAIQEDGLSTAELKGTKDLFALGDALKDRWQLTHPKIAKSLATHTALVSMAFMVAYRDYRLKYRADVGKFWTRKSEEALCLRTAPEAEQPADIRVLDQLQQSPIHGVIYQTLWHLFTESDGIDLAVEDTHDFADLFQRTWSQLLFSKPGEPLRRVLQGLNDEQGQGVRTLLAQDLVGWKRHDVFSNQAGTVDALPLEDIYVQPRWQHGPRILEALHTWLDGQAPIAAITAPFGHGKSLTARMLASDLAATWLRDPTGWYPMIVPCQGNLSLKDGLQHSTARALRKQLPWQPALTHAGLQWPADGQKTLIILDGLDEVYLDQTEQTRFLECLRDQSTDQRRFVVFTRPGAFPERQEDIYYFPLANFDKSQIEQWITNWPHSTTHPFTQEAIQERGLLDLASTPILLCMIARTWDELPKDEIQEFQVYQRYFHVLATTKLKLADHPVVAQTAKAIRETLRPSPPNIKDDKDALLWLLAQLAWDHAVLEASGEVLDRYAVETRLRMLKVPRKENGDILAGLGLVLQTDLQGSDTVFRFGHQSFKEYLIACHWRNQLRSAKPAEAELMGARLIKESSKAERFLLDMLQAEDKQVRIRIAQWAEACFKNTRLGTCTMERRSKEPCSDPLQDQRCTLREAAIAIRCALLDEGPLVIDQASPLRSLTGLFYGLGRALKLHAPGQKENPALVIESGVRLYGVILSGAHLSGAQFSGADLSGADLSGAHLIGANLSRAHLSGADLSRAHLSGADLSGADLSGADLNDADLNQANLNQANLRGAHLGNGSHRVRNLKHARNLEHAFLPEGWDDED